MICAEYSSQGLKAFLGIEDGRSNIKVPPCFQFLFAPENCQCRFGFYQLETNFLWLRLPESGRGKKRELDKWSKE